MVKMTADRAREILVRYIEMDANEVSDQYIRDMLIHICECTPEEIKELGLDQFWPDGKPLSES